MTTLRSFLLTCEPSTYDLITPANHRVTVTVIPGILRRFRFTSRNTMYTVDQVLPCPHNRQLGTRFQTPSSQVCEMLEGHVWRAEEAPDTSQFLYKTPVPYAFLGNPISR